MSQITRELALQHTRLQVLIQAAPLIAQDVLADFERNLVEEVHLRRQAFGDNAPVTEAEAVVLRLALTSLERSFRAFFSKHRTAFEALLPRAEIKLGYAV